MAKNLLSSGGSSGGDSGSGPSSNVNPGFSAELAYISGHTPMFEILDTSGANTDIIWFPIQRRLGPLNCQKIGLKIDVGGNYASDPVLGLVFDGGVMLSVLDIELDRAIMAHLKEISSIDGYSLDLQGMALAFNSGGVEISGGLIKHGSNGFVAYNGEALIKFEEWAISAIG